MKLWVVGDRFPDYVRYVSAVAVQIPDDLEFSALHLVRDAEGMASFDWAPIERICETNGINREIFRSGQEDNVSGLIAAWYAEHCARGGGAQDDA